MLCLSRRGKEQLILTTASGEVITVQVNEIEGGRVRLGIDAPQSVRIMRPEAVCKQPKKQLAYV